MTKNYTIIMTILMNHLSSLREESVITLYRVAQK